MKVQWHLPDHSISETDVPDIEQLLFILRLVGEVTLKGQPYQVDSSKLIVDEDKLSVAVTLSLVSSPS
ncbi:hypothetical protein [Cohnella silvisoli]|uniref:Uncharacterized protein n=1 Tax=Cohnella silvisoli TaxID=2873699 RepID=A0ABV1KXK5_9BACL|nr:hypothetical protein [Cohnella silvisoli]MCD9024095.1 hypothetical protein [Cohnella silvisoli]